jgi:hypothetical protein
MTSEPTPVVICFVERYAINPSLQAAVAAECPHAAEYFEKTSCTTSGVSEGSSIKRKTRL